MKKIIFLVLTVVICAAVLCGCFSYGPTMKNAGMEKVDADNASKSGAFSLVFTDEGDAFDFSGMNENSTFKLTSDSRIDVVDDSTKSVVRSYSAGEISISYDTSSEDPDDYTATLSVMYNNLPYGRYIINMYVTFVYCEDGVNVTKTYENPTVSNNTYFSVVPTPPVIKSSVSSAEAFMEFSDVLSAYSDSDVTWSVSDETPLPEGLTLDGATGRISGRVKQAGRWKIKVIATNETGSDEDYVELVFREHEHIYGDFVIEDGKHYKVCRCGEIAEEGAHSLTEIVDKQPTYTQTGLKHSVCEVCGYETAAEEIPMLEKPKPTATAEPTTQPTAQPTTQPAAEPTKAPEEQTKASKGMETGANDGVMAYCLTAGAAGLVLLAVVVKKRKVK